MSEMSKMPSQEIHKTTRSVGFRAQLDSAFPPSREEKQPQPPLGTTSSFQRMIEASQYGGAQNTVQSAIISQDQKAFLEEKLKEMETRIVNRILEIPLRKTRCSTPPIQKSVEKKFTMRGFETYEIIKNPDGTMSLKLPDPPPKQPRVPEPIPQCLVELAYHDRERMKQERVRMAALANRSTTQRGLGLKAMIDEAFR